MVYLLGRGREALFKLRQHKKAKAKRILTGSHKLGHVLAGQDVFAEDRIVCIGCGTPPLVSHIVAAPNVLSENAFVEEVIMADGTLLEEAAMYSLSSTRSYQMCAQLR